MQSATGRLNDMCGHPVQAGRALGFGAVVDGRLNVAVTIGGAHRESVVSGALRDARRSAISATSTGCRGW